MTERLKKILIGLGLLAFAGIVGYLLYATFFRARAPKEVSPPISPPTEEGGVLPKSPVSTDRIFETLVEERPTLPVSEVAVGGITAVSPVTLTPIKAPSLAGDGSSVNYYDPGDGRFYTTDRDGNVRRLHDERFANVDTVTWSPDANLAIAEFPDGANVSINFQTKEVVPLPQHWEDFDFAPHGQQIISKSIGVDPSNRWLVISNPDGSGASTIAALGNNQDKVQVNWSPNDKVVAFSDTGVPLSGFGRNQIIPIGKNDENFPGIVVEGFGFDATWSKEGTQILYSAAGPSSNYLPQVWLVDGEGDKLGQNRRSLPLNTWADKCTYASDSTAYCAVPQSLPPGSGLQRQLAFGKPDSLYRVDTKTGSISLVAVPETGIPMTNLSVSADGATLFYQHAINGTLGTIRLR